MQKQHPNNFSRWYPTSGPHPQSCNCLDVTPLCTFFLERKNKTVYPPLFKKMPSHAENQKCLRFRGGQTNQYPTSLCVDAGYVYHGLAIKPVSVQLWAADPWQFFFETRIPDSNVLELDGKLDFKNDTVGYWLWWFPNLFAIYEALSGVLWHLP